MATKRKAKNIRSISDTPNTPDIASIPRAKPTACRNMNPCKGKLVDANDANETETQYSQVCTLCKLPHITAKFSPESEA